MDPLSITASCIAVLQAATTSGSILRRLVELRHAPERLQELSNELEALRSLLVLLRSSLLRIRDTEYYAEAREPLEVLLRPVKDRVEEFGAMLEYRLKASEELNRHGLPKVSKREWVRANTEVHTLKQRIRDARDNLTAGLQMLSLAGMEAGRQTSLQIQAVCLTGPPQQWIAATGAGITDCGVDAAAHGHPVPIDSLPVVQGQSRQHLDGQDRVGMPALPHAADLPEGSRRAHGAATDTQALAYQFDNLGLESSATYSFHPWNPWDATLSHRRGSTPNLGSSTFRVDASISSHRCPQWCRCQCHAQTRGQTPRWLRSVFGQLMYSYSSLIYTRPCNYAPCQKQPRKSNFTYYFPTRLVSKALAVSTMVGDLAGLGATWSLRMQNVVHSHDRIWRMAETGSMEALRECFSRRHYSPYIRDEDGSTLLHRAVDTRNHDLYKYLTSLGADPGAEDLQRNTPLSMILTRSEERWYQQEDMEDVLDNFDFTPLHLAVAMPTSEHHLNNQVLQAHFQDISAQDRLGMTPLHWACRRATLVAVELLIQWNADLELKNIRGATALQHACWSIDAACVRTVLDAGADPNAVDIWGKSCLFYIPNIGAYLVDILVSKGADPNRCDVSGWTPLHVAARNNRSVVVQELLQAGAAFASRDGDGRCAILAAVSQNAISALQVLLTWRSLHMQGDEDPIQKIWEPDRDEATVLHLAALYGSPELYRLLTTTDLRGLDPAHEDKDGDSADTCFYKYRDQYCSVVRQPFEEEEAAWLALIQTVKVQNGSDESLGI